MGTVYDASNNNLEDKTRNELLNSVRSFHPKNMTEEKKKMLVKHIVELYGYSMLFRDCPTHITVAAYVLNESHDKVLMVKHNIFNTWCIPGGHADGDYNLLRVALNELQEETGITGASQLFDEVASIDLYKSSMHIRKGKLVKPHMHTNFTYLFEVLESAPIRIKEDENSEVAWIPVSDIEKYCKKDDFIKTYKRVEMLYNGGITC